MAIILKVDDQPVRHVRFAVRDSAEWHRIWQLLGNDPAARCACCGESWQYMGSWLNEGRTRIAHEFRHRHHPTTAKRENRRFEEDVTPVMNDPAVWS